MPQRLDSAWLVLLLLALAGCGGQDVNRPVVVSSYPASGSSLDYSVAEFRVVYDEPIHILDASAVRGYDDVGLVPMYAVRDQDPRVLRVLPTPGITLGPGSFFLELGAGFVANDDGQYRLESTFLSYEFGTGSNLFLASRGRSAVVEVDPETFAEVDATGTPAARAPVGLAASNVGAEPRIWVQLANGGGTGRSLAWFDPGDPAMTEVPLTTAGGDLLATRRAISLGRGGTEVYAAFRDETLSRVRLTRIDVRTGLETASLVLSPAASPATEPLDVLVSPVGDVVYVTCATAAPERLVAVSTDDFQEFNLGPDAGVDGLPIPNGAGSMSIWGLLVFIANLAQPTGDLTGAAPALAAIYGESSSGVVGHPEDILVTPDGLWLLEALRGYEDDRGLVLRTREFVLDPRPVSVATTPAGGGPAATSALALETDRARSRFLVLFDNSTLGVFRWDLLGVRQQDLDEAVDGVQPADLSLTAPDATAATFVAGIVPP